MVRRGTVPDAGRRSKLREAKREQAPALQGAKTPRRPIGEKSVGSSASARARPLAKALTADPDAAAVSTSPEVAPADCWKSLTIGGFWAERDQYLLWVRRFNPSDPLR
jgi:hypothetical protein